MREYGSEHPAIILPDGYFENLKVLGREITYLRSGREALLYVSCNCKPGKTATILFPAYCCWSMSAPFEKTGWNIIYYKLNENLTVDEVYLEQLLGYTKADAILTMNYYGSASTDSAVALAKSINPNIIAIEDFSHCTFSIKKIFNSKVDYYVSSIRKSIGICDGAVVLSKNETKKAYICSEVKELSELRLEAQSQKSRYFYSKDQESKERFLPNLKKGEKILDDFSAVRPISETAMSQLAQLNGEEIAYARRENMKHLWKLLYGKVKMVPGLEKCFENAPFSLPILVDNQEVVQKELAKRGVYTQVLWPISEEAQKVCPVSKRMGEQMLSIPIDQRYGWDDMEDMATVILDYLQ